jgi:hypothetical protein
MKKILGISVVLMVAAALWFFLYSKKSAPSPGPSAGQPSSAGWPGNASAPSSHPPAADSLVNPNPAPSPAAPANLEARAGAVQPGAASVPALDIPPKIVLQNVRHAIVQYNAMYGGNPVGNNPEITATLAGDNPKQVNFINPEAGMRINSNGELVDAWGTPFFFHQLSGFDMEVRSAGPDLKMWTPDDLVTR